MTVKMDNRARPLEKEGKDNYFEWEVYIDESDAVLDRIDHVIYGLHETFPEPIRTVANREEKFALRSRGWGEFILGVVVVYKDSTTDSQSYRLDLSKAWDEPMRGRAELLMPSRQEPRSDNLGAGEATEDVAAEEVASSEAKKEAIVKEVTSLEGEAQQEAVAEVVGSAASHVKVAAAREAVKSADNEAEQQIVVETVQTADSLGSKKAAAREAVKSAEKGEQREIIEGALEQASDKTRAAIGRGLIPDQWAIDRIWLMVVGAFAFVLCTSALALIAAVFIKTDQGLAQILLTVFTTVAGILAGFISGKAVGSASQ